MLTAICTISSQSHLFKVQALHDSLQECGSTADFHCLITDGKLDNPGFKVHQTKDLTSETAQNIIKKYKGNKLRWACKSLFITHLFQLGYEKVIYIDNDIYFYASPDFLFEELSHWNILLTPHHYPANPNKDQNWMEANFRVGLFNGGFIGVNRNAQPAMEWWAQCCLYNIKKSYRRGLFDDQKYLDLFPVLFEKVRILEHRGCNVAGWNIETSVRSSDTNGKIIFNAQWPLIFIHFNYYTIQTIVQHKDPLLIPHWEKYHQALKNANAAYDYKKEITSIPRNMQLYFDYIRYRTTRLAE